MRILMITEKDAANASLNKIADAFLRHGHYIEIYAPYYDSTILSCFSEEIPKYSLDALTINVTDSFDLIFASAIVGVFAERKGLLLIKKPIFTHNYLINKQIVWGGDYCFVPSLETTCTEYDSYFKFKKFEVGEPKYDRIKKDVFEKKQFLFIDSGHFPFGEQGKLELAKTLLSICHRFPEYLLVIKPRFLPDDKVVTHKNKLNLINFLMRESEGKLPDNLCILSEHRDLQELIEESHTVICMYTTAFAGAVLADKGLVILDCLPNEDTYDLRQKSFDRVRKQMVGSGALVDYHEVVRFLPHGVKAGDAYKNFLFSNYTDAAETIVQKVESLVNEQVDWNEIIMKRYQDYIVFKTFIHTDFHAKALLNIEKAYEKITKFVDTYVRSNLKCQEENFHKEIFKFSSEIRNESILKNKELFLEDEIDIGIYLNILYLTNNFEEILEFPNYNLGAVNYFKGMVYFRLGNLKIAEEKLLIYAEENIKRDYIKEISDMSMNKKRGMETLISLLEQSGKKDQADFYRKACR